jgi:hypothetical protein
LVGCVLRNRKQGRAICFFRILILCCIAWIGYDET